MLDAPLGKNNVSRMKRGRWNEEVSRNTDLAVCVQGQKKWVKKA